MNLICGGVSEHIKHQFALWDADHCFFGITCIRIQARFQYALPVMCLVCGSCRGPASAHRGNCRAESGVWGNYQLATDVWQRTLMGSQKEESVDILEQLKACLEMQCDILWPLTSIACMSCWDACATSLRKMSRKARSWRGYICDDFTGFEVSKCGFASL